MPPHEATEIPGKHRDIERAVPRWVVVVIAAVGVLSVVAGVLLTQQTGEVEDRAETLPAVEQQRDAAATQAQELGRQVIAACARGDVVQSPDGQNLCNTAAQVQADPIPGAPIPGEPGRPPTAEEIRAVVAQYMADNPPVRGDPGRPPTADEVAAAVAQHLTANPPQPGRPPTAGEIANAVATYFATNPPPQGPRGPRGGEGPGPTAEEIQAAVNAWLEANPPPQGPRGEKGDSGPPCPDGSSLQTVQFENEVFGLGCVLDEQPGVDPTVEPQPTTTSMSPDVDGNEPP
jgi:hypothetical protein